MCSDRSSLKIKTEKLRIGDFETIFCFSFHFYLFAFFRAPNAIVSIDTSSDVRVQRRERIDVIWVSEPLRAAINSELIWFSVKWEKQKRYLFIVGNSKWSNERICVQLANFACGCSECSANEFRLMCCDWRWTRKWFDGCVRLSYNMTWPHYSRSFVFAIRLQTRLRPTSNVQHAPYTRFSEETETKKKRNSNLVRHFV